MGSTGCEGKEREAGSQRNGLCGCIFSLQVLLPAESRHAAVCFSSEDVRYHRNVAHSEKLFRKFGLAKVSRLEEGGKVGSRTSRDPPSAQGICSYSDTS